jgi:hypothetical protein
MTAPVHASAGPTERAAQRKAARFAETLEGRVLAAVIEAGQRGLTAKEAREKLGIPVERHYSVAPRLSALKAKKLVEPTAMARDNFQAYIATSAGREELTPHERFEAEMNSGRPIVDNAGQLFVIGQLEYDGPRCADEDCDTAVDNDGEMCDPCGDSPHEFLQGDDPRFPDHCACGRIRSIGGYSPVHSGDGGAA